MPPAQSDLFERAPARPLRLGRAEVYVGTCSWTRGFESFYPRGVRSRPEARLRYYATVFPTVEVDATYYALLPAEVARKYVDWTPPGFVLNVKAVGLFTGQGAETARLPEVVRALAPAHLRARRRVADRDLPEEVQNLCWELFLDFCRPLRDAGKLGYLLFQFPRWVTYSERFFRRLDSLVRTTRGYRLAVEFRHRSWVEPGVRERVWDALRERRIAYVVPDEPQLDWTVPPQVAVTSDWSVVRFHGRNAQAWAVRGADVKERFDYLYTEEELRPWAAQARRIAEEVDRLFLMMNNCERGQAAVNAQMLLDLLGGG